ncbi:MAG TPA: Uma2 family endonuclease [Thermoanaerobaculia bacterium]|jgi:Uma2 family endonuclease|nr:Uma2 family endonuclease [Thermoanaerobaculia bacterium]
MTTRPDVRLTPEEYLRIERAAEWKSEYIDGEMFAMSGASYRHTLIALNLAAELRDKLRNGPCTVSSADLRVATDRRRHYTYPDVVVVCDPPQFVDDQLDTVTNPTLIAEVLSDSTEKYDRGGKFERYRSVPTLSEYMLVSQDRIHVELFTRQSDGRWSLRDWNDPAAEIEIESLHCRLKVAEVYAKVSFEDQAPG